MMGGENKIKGARLFSFYEDSSCQVRYWILWFLFKQAVQISCAHHHSCLPKFSAWLLFAFEKLLLLSVFWNLNNSPSNVVYCHLFEKGKKRRERKKEMKEWVSTQNLKLTVQSWKVKDCITKLRLICIQNQVFYFL